MTNQTLKASVTAQTAMTSLVSGAKERLADDRGEMGSYLILAAGLVVAAVAVVITLGDWFTTKATAITSN